MWIMHVYIQVKPEHVDAFREATIVNASNSAKEPGIARFDVIQQADDPTRFVLVEVYHNKEAQAAHRETAHYKEWAEKAAPMFADERTRQFFTNVYPPDQEW